MAGQPIYHQSDLFRRQAVYVTTTQPATAYLPAAQVPAAFTSGYVFCYRFQFPVVIFFIRLVWVADKIRNKRWVIFG